MKKNFVRIVAALLVAMLALTLIPMGALALTVYVESEAYEEYPTYEEWVNYEGRIGVRYEEPILFDTSVTIKASHYDSYVYIDGERYDLQGIADWKKADDNGDDELMAVTSSLKVNEKYIEKWGNLVWLLYSPHQHSLSRWYSDGTTHWRECLV